MDLYECTVWWIAEENWMDILWIAEVKAPEHVCAQKEVRYNLVRIEARMNPLSIRKDGLRPSRIHYKKETDLNEECWYEAEWKSIGNNRRYNKRIWTVKVGQIHHNSVNGRKCIHSRQWGYKDRTEYLSKNLIFIFIWKISVSKHLFNNYLPVLN